MTALGFALLAVGAALVVVEAHVPGGVFGVAGGIALIAGGIVTVGALGGGLALALPVALGIAVAVAGWMLLVVTKTTAARRTRVRAGPEGLSGQIGTVRQWGDGAGRVFVDGALWRARTDWTDALATGDPVVVERVRGLTLSVRRAEEWELL
jgi:membrane-bound ClpP family serine protease